MQNRPLKIFFSGIGGSGVSAIARFMADKGNIIAGSDRAFDLDPGHPLKEQLRAGGIAIFPQDGSGIDDTFDFAVFSTAVEPDRPEVVKARELGIPVKTRPAYLAEITASFKTIAVAGTSGKSTASGMLAYLMKELGMAPNFIGGGRVAQFRTATHPGNSLTGDSDYLVIEACESDGTIVDYRPMHSIILNLALDHHSVDKTSSLFEALMKNTGKKIILNADDENLMRTAVKDAVTFSIHKQSQYRAEDVEYKPWNTEFSMRGTPFSLSMPGVYNLYNALSCIAFLSEAAIPMKDISAVLPSFRGIDRRFNVHRNDGERLVIDDYAHNPHKISALMETVEKLSGNICYIFQPHGFGPTRMMKKEYIETFITHLRDTDHLILLPIYYAGGTAAKDISSHDLADEIKAAGRSVEVVEKRGDILNRLNEFHAYVVFGARDETLADFAREISSRMQGQTCVSAPAGISMKQVIKQFIQETLGCKCPDDVFEHVELERDVQLSSDVSLSAKINVGNRLLVYVLESGNCGFVEDNMPAVLSHGREERDRKGFNRFRLVLTGEKITECEQKAHRTFHNSPARDDKTHLHLIKDVFLDG